MHIIFRQNVPKYQLSDKNYKPSENPGDFFSVKTAGY